MKYATMAAWHANRYRFVWTPKAREIVRRRLAALECERRGTHRMIVGVCADCGYTDPSILLTTLRK